MLRQFNVILIIGLSLFYYPSHSKEIFKEQEYLSYKVKEIAEIKMPDLNASSIESAISMVKGTARSMGITVEG